MGKIRLSHRLRAVAGLVRGGGVLADIGTDHAYIPIFLIQEGRIHSAIASDVGEGPLLRAKENIASHGLEGRIQTRLCDGATGYAPNEADSYVLAGMGGRLMKKILSESPEVFRRAQEIILQPQSETEALRRYLIQAGYGIVGEDMVCEDGKYYPMMRALACRQGIASQDPCFADGAPSQACRQGAGASGQCLADGVLSQDPYWEAGELEEIYYLYGAHLLRGRHPILHAFLEREDAICSKVEAELRAFPETPARRDRISQMERRRGLAQAALAQYRD